MATGKSKVKEDSMDPHIETVFVGGLKRNISDLESAVNNFNQVEQSISNDDWEVALEALYQQIENFNATTNKLANQLAGPGKKNEPALRALGKQKMLEILECVTNYDGFLFCLVAIPHFRISLVEVASAYKRDLTEYEKEGLSSRISNERDYLTASDTRQMAGMMKAAARKMLDDFSNVKNRSIAETVRKAVEKYLQPQT